MDTMVKSADDNLNLETLLTRCKDLDPNEQIDLYFDPTTYFFFIHFRGVMPFWIPRAATYMLSCEAGVIRIHIAQFLSQAIIKLKEGIKT